MSTHPVKKEIRKIKLTLTTACNLSCKYCFVQKTNEKMSFPVAKKSINLLLGSTGEDKLLSMYGGEPSLEMDLIEKIVDYAKKKAKKHKKKLTISICTNLAELTDRQINFFKKNDIKITVSVIGPAKIHDQYRFFSGGKGTQAVVLKNLERLSKKISKRNIGISYCIIPSISNKIYDNFEFVSALGFFNFNFEIIQDFEKWRKEDQRNFSQSFKKIIINLLKDVNKNNFAYINTINWELVNDKMTEIQNVHCQIKYNIEVYPSGEMAFSPFLLNDKHKRSYLIGNIRHGIDKKYEKCEFNPKNKRCIDCRNKSYSQDKKWDNAHTIIAMYNKMSIEAARVIKKKAENNEIFNEYVKGVKEHLSF